MNAASTEPLIGVINAGSSSAQIQLLRGRAAASDRAGRWDRRPSFGERRRAQRRKARTPGSGCETADRAKRGTAGDFAVGQREARRQAARCARPPRRPWRAALFSTRAGHTGIAGRAGGAGAAGAIARAAQPGADQDGDAPQSRIAAGGVLRYRLSPHRTGGRAGLCASPTRFTRRAYAATAFMAFPTNTSPRYCRSGRRKSPMAASSWRISAMAARLAPCGTGFRSRRRWGSPRSMGCRWAPAAASSMPASCCISFSRRGCRRKSWSTSSISARACWGCPVFRRISASSWPVTDPRARFAIEVFCYRVAGHIASLAAALGGLDGIVFTAGVGENAAPVRSAICRACAWLGVDLDEAANREHKERISTPDSRVAAYVIKTDENLMIARHARALVGS